VLASLPKRFLHDGKQFRIGRSFGVFVRSLHQRVIDTTTSA
jgi:hypothetical protein